MNLHPQLIEKDGKIEFAVLLYDEFVKLQEELEDFEDLKELRSAKAESVNEASVSLDAVIKQFNL